MPFFKDIKKSLVSIIPSPIQIDFEKGEKGRTIKPTELIEFDWDKEDKEKQKIDYQELKKKAEYVKKLHEHKLKKNGE